MGFLSWPTVVWPAILLGASLVTAQYKPAPYGFDCRRNNVDCATPHTCNPITGLCNCPAGTEGYNCGYNQSIAATTCGTTTCQNDGLCTNRGDQPCFCDGDSYGTTCQNARVNVWCSTDGMFINIFPHGDDRFAGNVFINTNGSNSGRGRPQCQLIKIPDDEQQQLMTSYKVSDVQGNPTTLQGYYIAIPHQPPTAGGAYCGPAVKQVDEETNRTDYIQRVVVEYSNMLSSSLDQVHTFNCSVLSSATGIFSSINAMAVTIFNDNYQQVNITDTIEPIAFEIRVPEGAVITNTINLGDPLDLRFTLTSPAGSNDTTSTTSYRDFRVDSCTASNGVLDVTSQNYRKLDFLLNSCQAPGSAELYRGLIDKSVVNGVPVYLIQLMAFRFIGDSDQVSFTCQIKLCTPADLAADPNACEKPVCPEDTIGVQTSDADNDNDDTGGEDGGQDGGGTDEGSGGDDNTGGGDDNTGGGDDNTGGGDDNTGGGDDNTGGGDDNTGGSDVVEEGTEETTEATARRRRRSVVEGPKQVTQTINVTSGLLLSGSQASNTTSAGNNVVCTQNSDVVIIIVIFSVIMGLMVVVLVGLVVRVLRSRTKGAELDLLSDAERRYRLPRLAMNSHLPAI